MVGGSPKIYINHSTNQQNPMTTEPRWDPGLLKQWYGWYGNGQHSRLPFKTDARLRPFSHPFQEPLLRIGHVQYQFANLLSVTEPQSAVHQHQEESRSQPITWRPAHIMNSLLQDFHLPNCKWGSLHQISLQRELSFCKTSDATRTDHMFSTMKTKMVLRKADCQQKWSEDIWGMLALCFDKTSHTGKSVVHQAESNSTDFFHKSQCNEHPNKPTKHRVLACWKTRKKWKNSPSTCLPPPKWPPFHFRPAPGILGFLWPFNRDRMDL